MKKSINKVLLLIACLLACVSSYGYDSYGIDEDGHYWYFNFTGNNTAELTTNGDKNWEDQYYGDVVIPYQFTNKGVVYTVTKVGQKVFSNCHRMTSISFPRSISRIESGSFYGCTGLTSITLPEDLSDSFRLNSFLGCTNIKSINISSNNKYFQSINGILYSKDGSKLIAFPPGITGSFTIPKTVKELQDNSFSSSQLSSVILSDGMTSLSAGKFTDSMTSKLTSITISPSIKEIFGHNGSGSDISWLELNITDLAAWCNIDFWNENNLFWSSNFFVNGSLVTNLVIPEGVTKINQYAFNHKWFRSVTLPSTVTNISHQAFANCMFLEDVYCYAQIPPKCDNDTFKDTAPQHSTLHVPKGCIRTYALANAWGDFGTIIDDLVAGVDDIPLDESYNDKIEVYNIHGVKMNISTYDDLTTLPHGIYIVNGKKVRI